MTSYWCTRCSLIGSGATRHGSTLCRWVIPGQTVGEAARQLFLLPSKPYSMPHMVSLHHPPPPTAGFFMSCPFPGDLIAQFTKLQTLLAGWNSFTVSRAAPV